MSTPWEIRGENQPYTETHLDISLPSADGRYHGTKRFFLRNTNGRPLTASIDVLPDDETPSDWFSLDKAQLEVPAGETRSVEVSVAMPPARTPGDASGHWPSPIGVFAEEPAPVLAEEPIPVLAEEPAPAVDHPVGTEYYEDHSFQVRVRSFDIPRALSKPVRFSRPIPGTGTETLTSWPREWLDLSYDPPEIRFSLRWQDRGFSLPTGLSFRFDVGAPDPATAPWFHVLQPTQSIWIDHFDPGTGLPTVPTVEAEWKVTVDPVAAQDSGVSTVAVRPSLSVRPDAVLAFGEPEPIWLTFGHWRPFVVYQENSPWRPVIH